MEQILKRSALLLTAVCLIAFCFTGCGYSAEEEPASAADLPNTETDTGPGGESPEEETTETEKIESLYRDCAETVICISTSAGSNGTGFVYEENYVVTNAHVLYDADDFTLVDINGQEIKGTVVFEDYGTDIAVIQLDDYHGRSAVFGDSDSVSVGEQVMLIGNPLDGEPFSFCVGKRVELGEQLQQQTDPTNWYIPLDAHIVSGYSGGPVFNMRGELIGISNAAIIGDLSEYGFDYLSFIIPINSVKEQIEANCR